jgi:hypothetical protein
VIRDLIADGEYLVECIEQHEHGKIAVTLAQRSRAQPYSIQIETTENKLEGLFRALIDDKPARSRKPALLQIGSQPVPVVEVNSLPADAPKGRRRRKPGVNDAEGVQAQEPARPVRQRRTSSQQLVLVPQEKPGKPGAAPMSSKRRRTPRASDRAETR